MKKTKIAIGIASILLGGIGLFVETHSVDTALVSSIMLIGMGIASIATHKNSRWLCLIFACGIAFGAYMSIDVFPTLYTALAYMIVAVHIILFYVEISCPKETPQKQENKENNYREPLKIQCEMGREGFFRQTKQKSARVVAPPRKIFVKYDGIKHRDPVRDEYLEVPYNKND